MDIKQNYRAKVECRPENTNFNINILNWF